MAKILVRTSKLSKKDWLKARQNGIGGSDVGAICGLNKWKSPIAIYVEKTEPIEENEESEAAYWGITLEDLVAKEFSKRTGLKVKRHNALLQHDIYPFMLANLDRVITGPNGEKWGLECKTTSEYGKNDWIHDEIPESYLLQIQHYMSVTGFDKFYIAVLIGGNKFIYKEILRDEELINMLIELEKDFWFNHVEKRTPPDMDGSESSKELLRKMHPESDGSEVLLPFTALELIEKRNEVKDQIKELELKCGECENKLKSMLKDAEAGFVDKFKVTWKTYETNRFDSKKMRESEPNLYEKYINKSKMRKFDIKEVKGDLQ